MTKNSMKIHAVTISENGYCESEREARKGDMGWSGEKGREKCCNYIIFSIKYK